MEAQNVVILDSSFIIEVLRGKPEAHAKLSLLRKRAIIVIPTVATAELFYGVFKKGGEKKGVALKSFLTRFQRQPFDSGTDETCGKLMADLEKKGQNIGFEDCAIAATALKFGGNILTYNKKHFERIPGLTLL